MKSLLIVIWALSINRILISVADNWIRHWREAAREGSAIIRLGGSIARKNPLVVLELAHRVRFRAFGDSSLDFELLCWVRRPHDKGKLIHELNRNIYKAFNEARKIIPFPQRDVYVHSTNN